MHEQTKNPTKRRGILSFMELELHVKNIVLTLLVQIDAHRKIIHPWLIFELKVQNN